MSAAARVRAQERLDKLSGRWHEFSVIYNAMSEAYLEIEQLRELLGTVREITARACPEDGARLQMALDIADRK